MSDARDRILCIDYGQRFIGLAVADFPGITARALVTLQTDKDDVFSSIKKILVDENANRILLGYPYSDVEGEIHVRIHEFRAQLIRRLGSIPIEFVDESYSSSEADALIAETGMGRKKKKRTQDSEAAKIVLLRYLQS